MIKKQVLIVEDEAIVGADIRECLIELGFSVLGPVSSAEKGIETARAKMPDLVLMDIRLKGEKDGIFAAGEIQRELQIPVVFLTAHADEATLSRAKMVAPYGYVLKPFSEIELRVAIELALGKKEVEKAEEIAAPVKNGIPKTLSKVPPLSEEGQKIKEYLTKLRFFETLEAEDFYNLARDARFLKIKSGGNLLLEGKKSEVGFIVISGRVGLIQASSSGKELIIELLSTGDLYGLALPLEKEFYRFTVRAQVDSEVVVIPSSSLLTVLNSNTALNRELINIFSEKLSHAHTFSRELAHENVETRLCSLLAKLVKHFGVYSEARKEYELSFTRQELADMAGTTVETAIRITKGMERDGLIDLTEPGLIRIKDMSALEVNITQKAS